MNSPAIAIVEDLARLADVVDTLSKDKPLRRNRFSAHKDSQGDVSLRNDHYTPWNIVLEPNERITLNGPGYEQFTLRQPDEPVTITRDLVTAIENALSRKSNPGTLRSVQEFGEIPPPEDVEGFTAWYQRMAMAIVT